MDVRRPLRRNAYITRCILMMLKTESARGHAHKRKKAVYDTDNPVLHAFNGSTPDYANSYDSAMISLRLLCALPQDPQDVHPSSLTILYGSSRGARGIKKTRQETSIHCKKGPLTRFFLQTHLGQSPSFSPLLIRSLTLINALPNLLAPH